MTKSNATKSNAKKEEDIKDQDGYSDDLKDKDTFDTFATFDTFSYFSTEGRTTLRKCLVNNLYESLKSDNEENNKMMSFAIKSVHFMIPFVMVPLAVLSPIWLVYGYLIFCVVTKLTFWYLNGCFLSSVEYKLNKDIDINVVDPLVVAIGEKVTSKSRIEVTLKATNLLIAFLIATIIWKENGKM
jgi:hypothetical protein